MGSGTRLTFPASECCLRLSTPLSAAMSVLQVQGSARVRSRCGGHRERAVGAAPSLAAAPFTSSRIRRSHGKRRSRRDPRVQEPAVWTEGDTGTQRHRGSQGEGRGRLGKARLALRGASPASIPISWAGSAAPPPGEFLLLKVLCHLELLCYLHCPLPSSIMHVTCAGPCSSPTVSGLSPHCKSLPKPRTKTRLLPAVPVPGALCSAVTPAYPSPFPDA